MFQVSSGVENMELPQSQHRDDTSDLYVFSRTKKWTTNNTDLKLPLKRMIHLVFDA